MQVLPGLIVDGAKPSPTGGKFGLGEGESVPVLSGAPDLGDTVTLGFDNPLGTQTSGAFAGFLLGVANLLGVPLVYTGHSLGRDKRCDRLRRTCCCSFV